MESKKFILLYQNKFITLLVSSFNLSQSFNYTPYLFYTKTVQIRDHLFLYVDPENTTMPYTGIHDQNNFFKLQFEVFCFALVMDSLLLDKAQLKFGVRSPKFICAPCAQLYSLTETPQPPSYTRALLISQDRQHLLVIRWINEIRIIRKASQFHCQCRQADSPVGAKHNEYS